MGSLHKTKVCLYDWTRNVGIWYERCAIGGNPKLVQYFLLCNTLKDQHGRQTNLWGGSNSSAIYNRVIQWYTVLDLSAAILCTMQDNDTTVAWNNDKFGLNQFSTPRPLRTDPVRYFRTKSICVTLLRNCVT